MNEISCNEKDAEKEIQDDKDSKRLKIEEEVPQEKKPDEAVEEKSETKPSNDLSAKEPAQSPSKPVDTEDQNPKELISETIEKDAKSQSNAKEDESAKIEKVNEIEKAQDQSHQVSTNELETMYIKEVNEQKDQETEKKDEVNPEALKNQESKDEPVNAKEIANEEEKVEIKE